MEAFTQIATQLGIDHTFYYLFGMMFVLYFGLSTLYLRPFQKHLHDRREKTEGVKKQAQDLVAKADETFEQYKARMKDVNAEARKYLRENEELARKEESTILAEASNKAKASLQATQQELESQKRTTVEALSGEISGLANDIAAKVMGRSLGAR